MDAHRRCLIHSHAPLTKTYSTTIESKVVHQCVVGCEGTKHREAATSKMLPRAIHVNITPTHCPLVTAVFRCFIQTSLHIRVSNFDQSLCLSTWSRVFGAMGTKHLSTTHIHKAYAAHSQHMHVASLQKKKTSSIRLGLKYLPPPLPSLRQVMPPKSRKRDVLLKKIGGAASDSKVEVVSIFSPAPMCTFYG